MAVFPSIEIESKLQIQDKTRIDVSKSFVSNGADALTSLTVTPGADNSAIDVLNTVESEQYLEWQFNSWNGDFDSTNNKINFKEDGAELTATITPGTYTLDNLLIEIKTRMDTAGSLTYTVSKSNDDRITISTDSNFSLLPYSGTNAEESPLIILGFFNEDMEDNEFSTSDSYKGERVRYLPKFITVTADNGTDSLSITKVMKLYSVDGDALFSGDPDLITKKSDIMKWVKCGRNSFLNFHRDAQDEIIDFFRGKGFINVYGNPLTIKNFVKPEDLKQWSIFLTLRLIFDDISDTVDDIFYTEARQFEAREMRVRDRYMRIDNDNDGKSDVGEGINITSGRMFRR